MKRGTLWLAIILAALVSLIAITFLPIWPQNDIAGRPSPTDLWHSSLTGVQS